MTNDKIAVQVTHRFAAEPERAFDAWLDARTAGQWLFATPNGRITRCNIDARVGGKFSIVRLDGDEVDHVGEYLEIDRPRRLAFTFGVPRFSPEMTRVLIDIRPHDGGCELTLTNENVLADYGERNKQGWSMILDGLDKSLSAR